MASILDNRGRAYKPFRRTTPLFLFRIDIAFSATFHPWVDKLRVVLSSLVARRRRKLDVRAENVRNDSKFRSITVSNPRWKILLKVKSLNGHSLVVC
jgi:hypothetical protein